MLGFRCGMLLVLSLWASGMMGRPGSLTPLESQEINARLVRFARSSSHDASPLFARVPKFNLRAGRWAAYRPRFEKGSERFEREYCERILKHRFPELYEVRCSGEVSWQAIEGKDRVEILASGWIPREEISYHLDDIPLSGETVATLWSDDYWRTRWGLTSFRYSEYNPAAEFESYFDAVDSYAQPAQWISNLGLVASELAARVLRWSPAEKYDLAVGDEKFRLTNEQKGEGEESLDADGKVPDWMGLCHGWAAAATTVLPAMKPAVVVGARGNEVTFLPADLRALVTLHWANADFRTNYAGGRCNAKAVQFHPNGRPKAQYCFDSNPATFHLALGNLLGRSGLTFIMDKTFDSEVWNQPIESYTLTYFNPLDPLKQSGQWKDVVVDYDAVFKQRDRFQHPLTRGQRNGDTYDDSKIKKIVGVIASVTYAIEVSPPKHAQEPSETEFDRETYSYDLELVEEGGKLIAAGGEWHQNAHPDFLWMPGRGEFPKSDFDDEPFVYTGDGQPTRQLTRAAALGAEEGVPLCRVLKELLRRSTGRDDAYVCP